MIIWVSSYSDRDHLLKTQDIPNLISIMNPSPIEEQNSPKVQNDLSLRFDDIDGELEGYSSPRPEHIQQVIDFFDEWDCQSQMLIHCYAGQCRSPAAAIIGLLRKFPNQETAVVSAVREAGSCFFPNPLMIQLGDHLLGCQGRLFKAVQHMRAPTRKSNTSPIPIELANVQMLIREPS